MKKPVPLRRKSFGGQTLGIIWRKRAFAEPTKMKADVFKTNRIHRNSDNLDFDVDVNVSVNVESDGTQNKSSKKHKRGSYRQLRRGTTPTATACTTTTSTSGTLTTNASTPIVNVSFEENVQLIGWDESLCRPIYYRRPDLNDCDVSTVSGASKSLMEAEQRAEKQVNNMNVSSDNVNDRFHHNGESKVFQRCHNDADADADADRCRYLKIESFKKTIPVLSRIRAKTFASRDRHPRRPLSLVLTQDESNGDVNNETQEKRCREQNRNVTAAAVKMTDQRCSRFSAKKSVGALGRTSSKKQRNDNRNSSDIATAKESFEYTDSSRQHEGGRIVLNPKLSLERARDYFYQLDKTQPLLTLDSAVSPHISGKVTRTIRKTNFASPGIQRQYLAYSKSSVNSDITPLSIKDFASMRKLKKSSGQILDGFFDDE